MFLLVFATAAESRPIEQKLFGVEAGVVFLLLLNSNTGTGDWNGIMIGCSDPQD